MGIYVKQMFGTTGESTSLADLNKGTTGTTGAFIPQYDGKLLKIILMWSGEAVSSLIEQVRVELTCNIWSPNTQEFALVGAGIRTAPAFPIAPVEYVVDQPVKTTQEIKGQYAYDNAVTPVTADLIVIGVFSGP